MNDIDRLQIKIDSLGALAAHQSEIASKHLDNVILGWKVVLFLILLQCAGALIVSLIRSFRRQ